EPQRIAVSHAPAVDPAHEQIRAAAVAYQRDAHPCFAHRRRLIDPCHPLLLIPTRMRPVYMNRRAMCMHACATTFQQRYSRYPRERNNSMTDRSSPRSTEPADETVLQLPDGTPVTLVQPNGTTHPVLGTREPTDNSAPARRARVLAAW